MAHRRQPPADPMAYVRTRVPEAATKAGTIHPLTVITTEVNVSDIVFMLPYVLPGGAGRPTQCKARSRVAIVVAFRDREAQLGIFLRHLHPFLYRQLLDYRIFIIQMSRDGFFNKGALFNVGHAEIQKRFPGQFDCMVLQDVDVLPETGCISFACQDTAWHLASIVDKFNYTLLYDTLIGGSFQISFKDYEKANGFSNQYQGWGGEDDDFERRLWAHNITYGRFPKWSRWKTLEHRSSPHFEKRELTLRRVWERRLQTDGLNNVLYDVLDYTEDHLYTNITVRIKNRSAAKGTYVDVNNDREAQF